MLKTILPDEMKALEMCWLEETGMPSILMMEQAANAVVDVLTRYVPQNSHVLFLCGPGNNGGDGYAAACIWRTRGGRSTIWELSDIPKGDAATMRTIANHMQLNIEFIPEVHQRHPSFPYITEDIVAVVDALFGTGLARPIQGIARHLIRYINEMRLPVIAVDIPSGIHGATGEEMGTAIQAVETITFHRPKLGLYLRKGIKHSGKITVAPIFIEQTYPVNEPVHGFSIMEKGDLSRYISNHRGIDAHKGTYGRSVIFAGSVGMAGAAALCAMACIKAGAGLTTVLCRPNVLPVVQTLCPGATCKVLPECAGSLLPEALNIATEALQGARCAAIGPGLGQTTDLLPLLHVFHEASCPVIWDADALNLLARHGDDEKLLPLCQGDVITPHPGEAARLLGRDTVWVTDHPVDALEELRERYGCSVILKGARTLISSANGAQAINTVGAPALSKGGSGDILTGILAGLPVLMPISRTRNLQAAVLLHAMAGIRAAEQYGENNVLPEDVVKCIRTDV